MFVPPLRERTIPDAHIDHRHQRSRNSSTARSNENPQLGETTRFYNVRMILEMASTDTNIEDLQAASAELYGSDMPAPQTEETPFHPVSPYAVSKQFQFWTTVNFREAYGFHASNGILFNTNLQDVVSEALLTH